MGRKVVGSEAAGQWLEETQARSWLMAWEVGELEVLK